MTDRTVQPGSAEPDLASALAKDLKEGLIRDCKGLSEADFYVLREAVKAVDADRSGDTARRDMDAKIRKMSNRELDDFVRDCEAQNKGAK